MSSIALWRSRSLRSSALADSHAASRSWSWRTRRRRTRADAGAAACRRSPGDVVEVELPGLLAQPGLEDHLKQQIAELAQDHVGIAGGDGLAHLVGLFQRVGHDRRRRLRPVPGAAAGGIAQALHDRTEAAQGIGVVDVHGRSVMVDGPQGNS
jgi:hypothetical protein